MGMGKGLANETYNSITKMLHISCKRVFYFCCKKAVREAVAENKK